MRTPLPRRGGALPWRRCTAEVFVVKVFERVFGKVFVKVLLMVSREVFAEIFGEVFVKMLEIIDV